MPLTGAIRRREMDTTPPPVARSTNSGVSTVQGTGSIKRTVNKTIPLRKVIKRDTGTLADSQPLSADTLGFYGTSLGTGGAVSSVGIGGFSFSTIILVLLAAAVGYLLIRKGK